jgi:hypothetical protein
LQGFCKWILFKILYNYFIVLFLTLCFFFTSCSIMRRQEHKRKGKRNWYLLTLNWWFFFYLSSRLASVSFLFNKISKFKTITGNILYRPFHCQPFLSWNYRCSSPKSYIIISVVKNDHQRISRPISHNK